MLRFLFLLGLEVAVWFCLAAAFLFVYIDRHLAPADAVLPHLRVVATALLALGIVRLALQALLRSELAYRAAAAAVTGAMLAVMLAYYGLVLTGLASWGRVVTWKLIESYSGHAPLLAEILGISMSLALGGLGVVCLALLAAAWAYLRYLDWTPFVIRRASAPLIAVVLVSGSAFCAIELYRFTTEPPTEQAEPVSLMFYPLEAARNLQGHAVDRLSAARLDAEADAARTAYRPNPAAQRRNLVLIVVDALRADHLGVYGYPRDTTPYLSQLQRAGKLRKVGSMRAACSSSVCGLLSIMSSKFVHQLSYRPMTLQEALRRHGYRIHFVLSGDHTNFYGLKAAYGPVDSYVDGDGNHGRQYVNDDRLILDHLGQFPDWDGKPVFMQFHLMSVHILGRRDGTAAKYRPAENYARLPLRTLANARSERGVNYYDNGVLQTDAMIARLLLALERKGYLKQAVVAITADHGESLGEHGYYQHGNSVREEVLRVPFLLLSFGHQPARPLAHRALASQVDIAPTLLEEFDMPRPQTWSGTPLQESGSADFAHFQELGEVGLYDHRDPRHLWKYWVDSHSGQEYAYNLSLDPKELRNAIGEATEQQKREWRTRVVPATSMAVSARRPPR